jgi:hypothetical protein
MHHWAEVSDMLSTFFFGGTTKPLVFSFSANVPNRSPFAVFGFFLFFLFSVLLFLFIYSIFVWAFLGCLEDLGSRSKLICNDTLSAAVPRGFPALENRRRIFWGLFPTISHPAFLGFTGLPSRRVRSHNCGLCLSAFSPRNPMPRNFDLRFVVFIGDL